MTKQFLLRSVIIFRLRQLFNRRNIILRRLSGPVFFFLFTPLLSVNIGNAQVGITRYGNFALYVNTSGDYNSAFGYAALRTNSTGHRNTAVGSFSLYASTNSDNTATGHSALRNNTSGSSNTAIGSGSLLSSTTGSYNTAIGYDALSGNINGFYNTAIGYKALGSNGSGELNSALGYLALWKNKARFNSGFGSHALSANTTGTDNTACGPSALHENIGGSRNTAIGRFAGTIGGYLSNTTALGAFTKTTASNQVRIGNSAVTSIGGYVNWSKLSDGRVKKNIDENVPGLDFVIRLRPVIYSVDMGALKKVTGIENEGMIFEQNALSTGEEMRHTGFIAQEVEDVASKLKFVFSGVDAPKNDRDFYGLRYAEFVVPLVKAVQELAEQNIELQKEVGELRKMLVELKNETNGRPTAALNSTFLRQNVPNPAKGTTRIEYSLPSTITAAQLLLIDATGRLIKSMQLSHLGFVDVNVLGLASGVYNYTLTVEGKAIATRQMVVVK